MFKRGCAPLHFTNNAFEDFYQGKGSTFMKRVFSFYARPVTMGGGCKHLRGWFMIKKPCVWQKSAPNWLFGRGGGGGGQPIFENFPVNKYIGRVL